MFPSEPSTTIPPLLDVIAPETPTSVPLKVKLSEVVATFDAFL